MWCDERPLKEEFPDIYAMADNPTSIVASYMIIQREEVVRAPKLRRAAFDWEILRLTQLLNRLQGVRVNIGGLDRRVWRKGIEGAFSVRSYYDHVRGRGEVVGPWKMIWYNVVPLKVQFFVWTAALDRISTVDML